MSCNAHAHSNGSKKVEGSPFVFESGLAEGEGFEPPVAHHHGCFQDSCHQPDSAIPPGRTESTGRRPGPRRPYRPRGSVESMVATPPATGITTPVR
jgi:hypothetical protein